MKRVQASGKVSLLVKASRPEIRVFSRTFDRSFHFSWLKDHCRCPQCVDSSGQKLHTSGSCYRYSRPDDAYISESDLVVNWGQKHVSRYPLEDLGVFNVKKLSDEAKMRIERQRGHHFMQQPTISYDHYMNDPVGRAWAIRTLNSGGLVFVDQIPLDYAETFGEKAMTQVLAERIGPVMNTFYGKHWDVKSVDGAQNLAYTSKKIGWHQDLLYFESPPGIQILHSLVAAPTGGKTLFLDSVTAAERFEIAHPDEFKLLSKVQLTYEFSRMGLLLNQRRPVFAPSTSKDSHRRVYWSPEWQGTLNVHRAVSKTYHALLVWEEFLDQMEYLSVKLEPGSAVLFDNHRMLHARTEFQGARHLQGCYISRDEFRTALFEESIRKFKFANEKT